LDGGRRREHGGDAHHRGHYNGGKNKPTTPAVSL